MGAPTIRQQWSTSTTGPVATTAVDGTGVWRSPRVWPAWPSAPLWARRRQTRQMRTPPPRLPPMHRGTSMPRCPPDAFFLRTTGNRIIIVAELGTTPPMEPTVFTIAWCRRREPKRWLEVSPLAVRWIRSDAWYPREPCRDAEAPALVPTPSGRSGAPSRRLPPVLPCSRPNWLPAFSRWADQGNVGSPQMDAATND